MREAVLAVVRTSQSGAFQYANVPEPETTASWLLDWKTSILTFQRENPLARGSPEMPLFASIALLWGSA